MNLKGLRAGGFALEEKRLVRRRAEDRSGRSGVGRTQLRDYTYRRGDLEDVLQKDTKLLMWYLDTSQDGERPR